MSLCKSQIWMVYATFSKQIFFSNMQEAPSMFVGVAVGREVENVI